MAIADGWIPFLRKAPLLAGFREEDLKALAGEMQMLSLPKGAVLFRAGEAADALHLLVSGRLRLVEPGRGERTAGFAGRGDALGEMGLLTGEAHAHTAVVEATADFLVLPKAGFDGALAGNANMAGAISRFLSSRLLEAGRKTAAPASAARMYALAGGVPADDRVVLAVNLGVALVEQTRRRVLLLDIVDELESGIFARAMGLEHVRVNEGTLHREDLINPDVLRRLCVTHASGLELMSLPRALMEGRLAGMMYPFLSALKRSHDLVIAVAKDGACPSGRAVLEECDRVLVVDKDPGPPAAAPDVDPDKVWAVRLEEGAAGAGGPGVFRVPWRATFTATRSPFLPPDAERSHRAVTRLARKLGGVSFGFAMGSGAALGYVMVGFLKALERHGLYPDVIAGASMGALVGSFYAAGKTPAELEEIALSITKMKLWSMADLALPFPRSGLLYGWQVLRFLKSHLGDRTFAEMEVPFAAVATDVMTGDEVVLRHGKVAEAVRASLSLPFYFQPHYLNGRYLVDGGLVNPVPTSTIQAMGADVLVSVNITTTPAKKHSPGMRRRRAPRPGLLRGPSLLQVMAKTLYIMQYGIARTSSAHAHVLLEPDLSAFTWADFHRSKDIMALGEEYLERNIAQIKSHFPFFSDTCRVPVRSR